MVYVDMVYMSAGRRGGFLEWDSPPILQHPDASCCPQVAD
jgi:hypothetical protein